MVGYPLFLASDFLSSVSRDQCIPPNQKSQAMGPKRLIFVESFLGDSDATYMIEKGRFRG